MQKIQCQRRNISLYFMGCVQSFYGLVKLGSRRQTRDPIQNKTYVLCLISDEVTQAIGFLDEPQAVRMQLTLMGFPGGVPKYLPMSQNLCAETSGRMPEHELYQAFKSNSRRDLLSGFCRVDSTRRNKMKFKPFAKMTLIAVFLLIGCKSEADKLLDKACGTDLRERKKKIAGMPTTRQCLFIKICRN